MATSTEMSSGTASSEKKLLKTLHVGAPPSEPEHIPCPRCDSTNTKFCYYNNYNFSQPRHFCKSCRRYWTQGGTLRDIPVGGGSRKNAKRSRSSSSSVVSTAVVNSSSSGSYSSPVFLPPHIDHYRHQIMLSPFEHHQGGSFTSLLTTTAQGSGLFGLGGFGPGLVDELGRGVWPQGSVNGGWQMMESGGAECFSLPELAISTPGTMLK